MAVLKRIAKFLLAGVVVVLLVMGSMIGAAYVATSDTRTMGDQFVEYLKADEIDQAYGMLHQKLQQKLSPEEFNAMIVNAKLNTLQEVSWNGWNKDFDSGIEAVSGTGTTSLDPDMVVNAKIEATDKENDGKPGILAFNFEPAGTE